MKVLVPLLIMLLLKGVVSVLAAPAETYGSIHHAVFLGNRGPDLISFDLPGLHPLLGRNIEVRLQGLDFPGIAGRCEKETRRAEQGREVVRSLLAHARSITLQDVGRDRSFRITATVLADGHDIRQVLMAKGLARRQGTESPPGWCE